MTVKVELGERSYDITIEKGALSHAEKYISPEGKTLIVTDDGVPSEYTRSVAEKSGQPTIITVPHGEESKSFENYRMLCSAMLEAGFTRTDKVVAVGGGVVGDLAGFAASTYMRGIDFYNIPTTLLSQVDSSVGGKTAIDLDGIKNIVGTFYQPKAVIIDPDTLKTLDRRQLASGMAEALKMAATSDKALFELIESGVNEENIGEVIRRALIIKADVVSRDEKETGLRRILNFGHTLGHGIESLGGLYHGECVALGMLCMCSDKVYPRLFSAISSLGLKTKIHADADAILLAASHDKKRQGDAVCAVLVNEIGTYEIKKVTAKDLRQRLSKVIN